MFWIWTGFIVFVLSLLALDLGVFNRKAHVIGVKEALGWSALWIALGLLFSIFIYFAYENHWMGIGLQADDVDGVALDGRTAAIRYLTGYVVEKSLSIDNIFVIAMIFRYFAVPAMHQHRVLFWGIVGALLMRGGMIAAGAALIHQFHWILYVFGVFLLLTAAKMFFMKSDHGDPGKTRSCARPPLSPAHRSIPRRASLSAPAVGCSRHCADADRCRNHRPRFRRRFHPRDFAITTDAFLVFTSNVFAMLGCVLLSRWRRRCRSSATSNTRWPRARGVGVKMLAAEWFKELLSISTSTCWV
jgi:tellurite resistance protein TerC